MGISSGSVASAPISGSPSGGGIPFDFGDGLLDRLGQTFTPVANLAVESITMILSKTGAPADTLVIDIARVGDPGPPTTDQFDAYLRATSTPVSGTSLGATLAAVVFGFSAPVTLTAGTQYTFALRRTGGSDNVNYYMGLIDVFGIPSEFLVQHDPLLGWSDDPDASLRYSLTEGDRTVYNIAKKEVLKLMSGESSAVSGKPVKAMLVLNTYVFNPDEQTVSAGLTATEAAGAARQTLTSLASNEDDTNDFGYLTDGTPVFPSVTTGQALGGMATYWDVDGTDANAVPLAFYPFTLTTDGRSITVTFAAAGSGGALKAA